MPPKKARTGQANGNGNDQGGQVDPAMAQILDLLRQQNANIAQQQQQLQQQMQQQQPPQLPVVVTFKSFQAVKPLEFSGSSDPVEAQTWLKEIEKAFVLTRVGNDQKTEYASYFLKNEANYWWESTKALQGQEVVPWDRFSELFLDKYCPRYMRNQMELKFFELKQGNMTVSEYERKFSELARFVEEYVNTDEKRAKRFQQGLKPWIRSRVAVFELNTYAGVVQKAMIIESENNQFQEDKEKQDKKRKAEPSGNGQGSGNYQNRFNKPSGVQPNQNVNFRRLDNKNPYQGNRPGGNFQQGSQPPPVPPECRICGKRHFGICKVNVTCYKCNQKGHFANECRNKIVCTKCGKLGHATKDCRAALTNNVMRATGPPRARVFNMNMNDVVQDADVIAGFHSSETSELDDRLH